MGDEKEKGNETHALEKYDKTFPQKILGKFAGMPLGPDNHKIENEWGDNRSDQQGTKIEKNKKTKWKIFKFDGEWRIFNGLYHEIFRILSNALPRGNGEHRRAKKPINCQGDWHRTPSRTPARSRGLLGLLGKRFMNVLSIFWRGHSLDTEELTVFFCWTHWCL
jgi:hypothetical protein